VSINPFAEYFDGVLYLLVGGRVLEYSLDGGVHARHELVGTSGEGIYAHRIWITDNGTMYITDKAHVKAVYEYLL
jgi:hypothetical protein